MDMKNMADQDILQLKASVEGIIKHLEGTHHISTSGSDYLKSLQEERRKDVEQMEAELDRRGVTYE